ncbi:MULTISPECIES: HAMP domain-containing histidine kinase [Bacillus]|uniref:HAMP domain-containing histidine kinase n=1 Tax=Bacillus TaxID=1386 RepID=UPI00031854DA|nr:MULTISPECIES: HAMP domain-containing histidine kinase [Bacillus]
MLGFFLLVGCSKIDEKEKAEEGVLTIQSFPEKESLKLNGEWEFYWEHLYTPKDFQNKDLLLNPHFADIPSSWSRYKINGQRIASTGFATYRIKIDLGLAISKEMIEYYQGKIAVESIMENGATFYFTLPRIKEDA